MAIYGFVIGLASSLMGISGGSISTIVLMLYGKPMHQAVATSAGMAVPISIAGAIGYMLAGLPQRCSDAAALDRLRVAHRIGLDGAGVQLVRALRRAVRAPASASGRSRSRFGCFCSRRVRFWCI